MIKIQKYFIYANYFTFDLLSKLLDLDYERKIIDLTKDSDPHLDSISPPSTLNSSCIWPSGIDIKILPKETKETLKMHFGYYSLGEINSMDDSYQIKNSGVEVYLKPLKKMLIMKIKAFYKDFNDFLNYSLKAKCDQFLNFVEDKIIIITAF